jgi:hypothetical protein
MAAASMCGGYPGGSGPTKVAAWRLAVGRHGAWGGVGVTGRTDIEVALANG